MNHQLDRQIQKVSPQIALDSIIQATATNLVILDFDETLWLRNSTAEYINSLRPRWLGFLAIACLKVLKPWKWLPSPFRGDQVRDWFLVVIPTILFPWNILLWHKRAKELAQHANPELISAVNSNQVSQIMVASLGFNFVIKPIVQQLPMRCDRLISCRFWQGAKDRSQGKLLMMEEVCSPPELRSAILVTDSQDDLPLLKIVQQPCLVIWSSAEYRHPFQNFWLASTIQKLIRSAKNYK